MSTTVTVPAHNDTRSPTAPPSKITALALGVLDGTRSTGQREELVSLLPHIEATVTTVPLAAARYPDDRLRRAR